MPGFAALEAQIGEQAARQQVAEQGASDILRNDDLNGRNRRADGRRRSGKRAFQRVTTGAKGGLFRSRWPRCRKEAGQELLQSGGERAVQNIATRDYLDPNQSVIRGVVSDALSGAPSAGNGRVAGGGSHLVKGPLQKRRKRVPLRFPTDAATIPPGGQTSATIPPEAAQPAGIPAGTVPAILKPNPGRRHRLGRSEHASRAGISPVPVSTAEPLSSPIRQSRLASPLLINKPRCPGIPACQ